MCDDDDNQDEESDEEDELLSQLLCPIQSPISECTRSLVEQQQRPRPMDETKFRFGDLEVVLPPAQEVNMAQCVWKGALLTAAFIGGQLEEISAPPTLFTSGSEVLEIGCGRGLVGLVAAARGASRVVLTDCDDRVLSLLDRHSSTASSSVVSVAHLLWEQDLWEESIGAEGTPQRHWSDAYRNEDIPALPYGQQFDLVIGCECLYFPSQEAPLAAVLRQRLLKPNGVGIIVMQQRDGEAFQLIRFMATLKESGFIVRECARPWDYEKLLRTHIRCFPGQEELVLTETKNDVGVHRIVTIGWPN